MFHCLDREGRSRRRKYVWINGRQVWMFSRLYNTVERRPAYLDAARLLRFPAPHARETGALLFRVHARRPSRRDPTQTIGAFFVVLGWIEYSRTCGEERAQREGERVVWAVHRWIADPGLLGRPSFPGAPMFSQLADIMVPLSLAIELAAVDPDPRVTARFFRELHTAAMRHLDPERQVLLENVSPDGTRRPELPEGRLVSPGHVTEVCWFLLHLLEIVPDAGRVDDVLRILDASLHFGWDREYGGLLYFVDTNGPAASATRGKHEVVVRSVRRRSMRWCLLTR